MIVSLGLYQRALHTHARHPTFDSDALLVNSVEAAEIECISEGAGVVETLCPRGTCNSVAGIGSNNSSVTHQPWIWLDRNVRAEAIERERVERPDVCRNALALALLEQPQQPQQPQQQP